MLTKVVNNMLINNAQVRHNDDWELIELRYSKDENRKEKKNRNEFLSLQFTHKVKWMNCLLVYFIKLIVY